MLSSRSNARDTLTDTAITPNTDRGQNDTASFDSGILVQHGPPPRIPFQRQQRKTFGSSMSTAQRQEISKTLGTILLIHGFPQTSYQFRKVIPGLSKAGYRVVVPDYRGAGGSSKPMKLDGYRKTQMATDLHRLIHDHIGIKSRVHVVGHDIGGMVAHAYASLFADDISSVIWGECPLPGTTTYDQSKTSVQHFHFNFHSVLDLPEALTADRERIYLQHFYDKLTYNSGAITPADTDFYTSDFSKPGAMRAGLQCLSHVRDRQGGESQDAPRIAERAR